MDVTGTSKWASWVFFLSLSGFFALIVFCSSITPDFFIIKSYSLKAGREFWKFDIEKLTSFNQVLFLDVLTCSEESVWSLIVVKGSNQVHATDGEVVWKEENQGSVACEAKRHFFQRVRFKKYLVEFGIVADSDTSISVGFQNPEYLNFCIVVTGIVFLVCSVSCYLFLRFTSYHVKSRKNIFMLSLSCLIYTFPFKLLSVIWNLEMWSYFELVSRFFYLLVFFSYVKSEGLSTVKENIIFYTVVTIFTFLNILTRSFPLISLLFVIILALYLSKFYLAKVQRFPILSIKEKIELLIDLFMTVFLTLSVQSGVLSESNNYPSLATLCLMVVSSFLLYTHWGCHFLERFQRKALDSNSSESEMISFPSNLNF